MHGAVAIRTEGSEVASRVIWARLFQERKRFEMVNLDDAASHAVCLARIKPAAGANFAV